MASAKKQYIELIRIHEKTGNGELAMQCKSQLKKLERKISDG